ncbi:FxLYD domain-containing protein [Methanoculleus caldifontis]|uniref:FxLYD domain-containing protein n=1 Tax=Methanoculleus caldifontis TaxID=2651577 RepID=UPI0029372945|nr:FxLYD domain-containing protein [Methanoculleus sp. Wushi-C6]
MPLLRKACMGLLLFACLAGAVFVTGCTETSGGPEVPTPTPEETPAVHAVYTPDGPQPSFSATITASERRFRADGSCYWVVTGRVTNTGTAPGRNVAIRFMLIDDENGMIRSTETIFVPRFPPGEAKMFTIDPLPGDCDRQYHAEIAVTRDIP